MDAVTLGAPLDAATIVGFAVGTVLVGTAVAIIWHHKKATANGIMIILVGLVFIGMSQ